MSRWISVKDRLPPEDLKKIYLVAERYKEGACISLERYYFHAPYNVKHPTWHSVYEEGVDDVQFWMEIPDLPEEE